MNGLVIGLLLPFLGTTLGAACVFLMRKDFSPGLHKTLTGFAAGVMVAASVWSLLIPSMEMTGKEGIASIIPAIVGFLVGIFFLLFLDSVVPHQHVDSPTSEGPKSHLSKKKRHEERPLNFRYSKWRLRRMKKKVIPLFLKFVLSLRRFVFQLLVNFFLRIRIHLTYGSYNIAAFI